MTQSPMISPNHVQKPKFISCIKINGVPILPPLITPEKRKELRRLKREAIRVERRVQREREMKEYVTELYKTCTTDIDDETITINTTSTTPIGHMINQGVQTAFIQSPKQALSLNVQATQYVNNEFDICVADTSKSPIFLLNDLDASTESKEGGTNQTPARTTPKLIRSNSYTLDAPSPALIEHYIRASRGSVDTATMKTKSCWDPEVQVQQCLALESARSANTDDCDHDSKDVQEEAKETVNGDISKMNTSALETFITNDLEVTLLDADATPRTEEVKKPDETPKFLDLNSEDTEDYFDTSRTETELVNLSDCEVHFPMQEFIANNLPVSVNGSNSDCQKSQLSHDTSTDPLGLDDDESTSDWNSILKKIPSSYSRHILEFLEQQQVNQSPTNYDSCGAGFDELLLNPEKYSTPHGTTNTTQIGDTVYYSVHEDHEQVNEQIEQTSYEDLCSELLPHKSTSHSLQTHEKSVKMVKCPLTREEAATVLTSAARGFLIRRLMKTEKVQHLIETIKDAVLCAMQLHHDTLDYIEEADVELHRRLIQQVSAACYSFHGVFFATSIQDQMACIAVDRQKKLDKQRRISASHCSASIKSDSSSRSRKFSQRS